MNRADRIGADRMALAIIDLVDRKIIDSRSPAADAALDYIRVGCPDGPASVQDWVSGKADRIRPKPIMPGMILPEPWTELVPVQDRMGS